MTPRPQVWASSLHRHVGKPAGHQPAWEDRAQLERVRDELTLSSPLVSAVEIRQLRSLLARVAVGDTLAIQAGDCAEDPAECGLGDVARKIGLLDELADLLTMMTHKPVVIVGRIAGQFAKPRSSATEVRDGTELPVFRGHMVNSPEPDPARRRPDARRLLTGYAAASEAMIHLRWLNQVRMTSNRPPVWTSHEALLLDYEIPMVRYSGGGLALLCSTHWPWIGERTRQVGGAHVALLAGVVNPVACKVGPRISLDEILALCDRLDPYREPGRLTLIVRMGADHVGKRLPRLVRGVKTAGHPVVWLTDPMHGNTITRVDGLKTRLVDTIVREVQEFQHAVSSAGGVAGGLHLETTPDDVTECVADARHVGRAGDKYTSLCDPRLNPRQARSVVAAWRGSATPSHW